MTLDRDRRRRETIRRFRMHLPFSRRPSRRVAAAALAIGALLLAPGGRAELPAFPGQPEKIQPIECSRVITRERVVALTFDDGPHATLTPRLLDILKAANVRATFFVIGMNVEQNPDVLRRALAEGHEIGNHSWSHPNLATMPEEGFRAQVQDTHEMIVETVGRAPQYLRPPYGNITPAQEAAVASGYGYRTILWSVDPKDWGVPPRAVLIRRVVSRARPGGIILLHDIHPSTVGAVPAIIVGLRQRGFRFLTVSQLLALEPGR